ncbi:L-aminopeptidase/D-esterase [Serratia ficaria]|uniref:P1 family peptidase n=1 Tax=Serratia ficaria TaxID=61651 RepID=UPI00217BCC29|nr:P1 family peptidase [Serratia ficaria]CAI2130306.1 L-aminopeptidase/D-esterase [Serratia ficaria]CAI2524662.1 L-aminopeptidase/D-esterase [Serratia ficaria]
MHNAAGKTGPLSRPLALSRRTFLQALACLTGAVGVLSPTTLLGTAMSTSATLRTGARNLITDVPGLKVGVAQDSKVRTGATVILPDRPAIAAVDVRGGGPATRETDALGEDNLVQTLDALVLSGGSVYGLAAADGVAAWLGQQGKGYALRPAPGVPVSPIVPTACLYDLSNAGDKDWQLAPPYRQLGIEAAGKASLDFPLGTVGAGYGAMTGMGKLKGGLGSASAIAANGAAVGALVAVNSLGSVVAPGTRAFWATPYEINGEFGNGGAAALAQLQAQGEDWMVKEPEGGRKNTTLACIATDLALTRVELKRVAIMAQDGMARAIRPLHSPFDGDVVFALSTGQREVQGSRELAVLQIGALAADTLARAIARGVYAATPWPGSQVVTWRSLA